MPDYFARDLSLPHIVAVTEDVVLETSDPDLTNLVSRGIYAFTSFKEARHFTTVVNSDLIEPVAFRFKRLETDGEEND